MEEALEQEIRQLGLQDTAVLCGFVENVAPLLSMLDVQLNASTGTEMSSLALIEGMSLGLPTIASSYGGNPYLIQDGYDGLLFAPGMHPGWRTAWKSSWPILTCGIRFPSMPGRPMKRILLRRYLHPAF